LFFALLLGFLVGLHPLRLSSRVRFGIPLSSLHTIFPFHLNSLICMYVTSSLALYSLYSSSFYLMNQITLIVCQVPDVGQCVSNLHLNTEIPTIPTIWRTLKQANSSCQIEESTPNNTYGFRMSFENLNKVKAICEVLYKLYMILPLQFCI
jgi:hypothetical protein